MSVQKEDVYETEDVVIDEGAPLEERFDNPEVEKIHVDVEGALKKFGGRMISSKNVDFSDSVVNRRRRGYGGGQYVIEVVGPEYDEPETLEQKYNRLHCELNELMEAVLKEKENQSEKTSITKSDLEELNDVLKAAQVKRTAKEPTANVPKESNTKLLPTKSHPVGDLANLEARIQRIEKMLKSDNPDSENLGNTTFSEAVEDLRMRVDALNPIYLDNLESKLNNVLTKLSQVDDKRNERSDVQFEERVNKLYEMVSKWDTQCSNLPSIVKRMHSLATLHEQAENWSSKLNEMVGIKSQILKKIENDRVTLVQLRQDSFKVLEELTTKIANLEKVVKK
uniref:Dynactin subunit 2 n=1 Tax=Acrobeloides nanus TaxID=290746 RepID=A0A914DIQ4_9BILA